MKLRPSVLVAMALISMATLGSCTKNYTCQCVVSYTGQPGLPDTVINSYPIKDTKSGAKSKCSSNSATYTQNGITTVENCYLY